MWFRFADTNFSADVAATPVLMRPPMIWIFHTCRSELILAELSDIEPGQVLCIDVQPNMAKQSLTKRDCFANHINIADAKSRKFGCMGTEGTTSQDAIRSTFKWASQNKPSPEHTLEQNCHEIHVDAGSQLTSKEFCLWCEEETIALIAAAPHHQEMNGICERMWQSARKIAFSD